jgi:hypothetical protein
MLSSRDYTEIVPAGRIAFESSMSCVLRNEATTDCCMVGGTARLKLDFVAIPEASKDITEQLMVLFVDSPCWRCWL